MVINNHHPAARRGFLLVIVTSTGSESSFRQEVDAFAEKSINNPVDVHRLAYPKAGFLITRFSQSFEQTAKAAEVRFAVHGVIPVMTAPSLYGRIQVLMEDKPFCDVDHWRKP